VAVPAAGALQPQTDPLGSAHNGNGTSGVPVNTVAPTATGKAAVGGTLRCQTGTWADDPTSFKYQWRRGAKKVKWATVARYRVGKLDAGRKLTCTVTALNLQGAGDAVSTVAVRIPASRR
jgi:hypothetical protein